MVTKIFYARVERDCMLSGNKRSFIRIDIQDILFTVLDIHWHQEYMAECDKNHKNKNASQ